MSFSQNLRQLGQPIAYYKGLAKPLGGVTAAILFSQLFFWHDKTDNPLGVYKQLDELCEETGMSLDELRTARKKLVDRKVLVETHKRLEHRIYFKLDLVAFDAFIDDYVAQFGEQGKTDFPKSEKQSSRNGKSLFGEQGKTDFPKSEKQSSRNGKSLFGEQGKTDFVNTEDYIQKNTTDITTLTGCNTHAHAKVAKTKTSSGGDLVLLAEFGVTGELAEDFVKHRKAMKAPITKTALNGFQREADKAKIPITQAVAIAIERGWRGFRSDWDWQGLAKNPTNSTACKPNSNKKFDAHSGFAEREYGETVIPDWAMEAIQ